MTFAWLLYAIALGAAFALAALAAERALVAQARPARWVWCAAIATSLAVPFVAYLMSSPIPVTSTVELGEAVPLVRGDPSAVSGGSQLLARLGSLIPYLWILASSILLVRLAWSDRIVRLARHRWPVREIDGVAVLESPTIGPAVVGLFGTRIAVPRWLGELDRELQRLAILHEREHQRRRDPLLLWAGWLACAAVPWNPALWWQLRRLRLAIEVDCDRRVLASGVPVARYGELLLEVGRRIAVRPLAAVALFETRSFLERRIRTMTSSSPRRALLAIAATAAIALVVGFVAEAPVPAKPVRTESPDRGEDAAVAVMAVPQDTPGFTFTPYTVKPRCIEGCTAENVLEHMDTAGAPASCDLTIGIRIDTTGHVTATDLLEPSGTACDEGAHAWAVTTRWSAAELDGRPVVVWMAQPIGVARDPDSAEERQESPRP